jgi:hypothetical protein
MGREEHERAGGRERSLEPPREADDLRERAAGVVEGDEGDGREEEGREVHLAARDGVDLQRDEDGEEYQRPALAEDAVLRRRRQREEPEPGQRAEGAVRARPEGEDGDRRRALQRGDRDRGPRTARSPVPVEREGDAEQDERRDHVQERREVRLGEEDGGDAHGLEHEAGPEARDRRPRREGDPERDRSDEERSAGERRDLSPAWLRRSRGSEPGDRGEGSERHGFEPRELLDPRLREERRHQRERERREEDEVAFPIRPARRRNPPAKARRT